MKDRQLIGDPSEDFQDGVLIVHFHITKHQLLGISAQKREEDTLSNTVITPSAEIQSSSYEAEQVDLVLVATNFLVKCSNSFLKIVLLSLAIYTKRDLSCY